MVCNYTRTITGIPSRSSVSRVFVQIADKISSSLMDAIGMIEDQKQLDDKVKYIVILQ